MFKHSRFKPKGPDSTRVFFESFLNGEELPQGVDEWGNVIQAKLDRHQFSRESGPLLIHGRHSDHEALQEVAALLRDVGWEVIVEMKEKPHLCLMMIWDPRDPCHEQ